MHPSNKRKKKILFVCEHNSARSQMAEALLKVLAPDRFDVQSAGTNPGNLNPLAIAALKEIGIDISMNRTKGLEELLGRGEIFDMIITVCDPAAASCPVLPGTRVLQWNFEDPSKATGTEEEKLEKVRGIRDAIRKKIEGFILEKAEEAPWK